MVLLEGVALVQYDIYVWRKSEADSGLFKHAESIVAITYVRSVVDHTKVAEGELNDAIYRCIGKASVQEVIEYKKLLIDLFKLAGITTNSLPQVQFAKEEVEEIENVINLTNVLKYTNINKAQLEDILKVKESKDTAYANELCKNLQKIIYEFLWENYYANPSYNT
jgi:hypothetical protein